MKTALLIMVASLLLQSAGAEPNTLSRSFQQGVNNYFGASDTYLHTRHGREDWNEGASERLEARGHAGGSSGDDSRRRESLIKFENITGPGGIPADISHEDIVSATLTLTVYRANYLDENSLLQVLPMFTPWEAGHTTGAVASDGESTASARYYRGDGNYAAGDYWGEPGGYTEFPSGPDITGEESVSRHFQWITAGPFDYMSDGEFGSDGWPVDLDVTEIVRAWFGGTVTINQIEQPLDNHGFNVYAIRKTWQVFEMYSSNFQANPEWRPKLTIEYIERASTSFQQGVDGYTGTQDTWLQTRYGRENLNAGGTDTLHTAGHAGGAAGDESRRRETLIRFDDVFSPDGLLAGLSADDVFKATLTMTVYRANALNDLRVYGMITPWKAGDKDNAEATEGESTAAHRFHREDGSYAPVDHWGDRGEPVEFPTMGDVLGELHHRDMLDSFGPVDYMTDGEYGEDGWPVDLDVTAAVKGWLNGDFENHGFRLRSQGSNWQTYDMYSSLYVNPEWRPKLTIEHALKPEVLSLDLKPGYQFISSNLAPLATDLRDGVFASLIERGTLDFVRDDEGRTLQQVEGKWVNNIGDWVATAGYLVRMKEPDKLEIVGRRIPPYFPIELKQGEQFIAYLPDFEIDTFDLFEKLTADGLGLVRDSQGGSLQEIAGQWRDGIGTMRPGQGYLVKMDKPGVVIAPGSEPVQEELKLIPGGTLPSIGNGQLNVDDFRIGVYPVTWGEWRTVRDWAEHYDLNGRGRGREDGHPVHSVTWHEALKWCNARSEMEGLTPVYTVNGEVYREGDAVPDKNFSADGYRLPTEPEWEFAARGGNHSTLLSR